MNKPRLNRIDFLLLFVEHSENIRKLKFELPQNCSFPSGLKKKKNNWNKQNPLNTCCWCENFVLPVHRAASPLAGFLQAVQVWLEDCCWLLWTEERTLREEAVQKGPAAEGSRCPGTVPDQATDPSLLALSYLWRTPPCLFAGLWGQWNLLRPPGWM